jgi:chitin disaccharide deacetylase
VSGKARSIIITGDDFGSSRGVNQAIIQAHCEGILTSASLMVTGEAFEEAVLLAHQHRRLAVGLHLVLIDGKAALPPGEVAHLTDGEGRFPSDPFVAGGRGHVSPAAVRQVHREIRAQLEKFRRTGLTLSHVDGHQHMHLTPAALTGLIRLAPEFKIRAVRVPSEELGLAIRIDRRALLEKIKLSAMFGMLRPYAMRRLRSAGIRFPDRVYGLLQNGRVTEGYLLKLVPKIRADRVELYSHPAAEGSTDQLTALVSGSVRKALDSQGFRLTTYHELN